MVFVHALSQRVLEYIRRRELLRPGERVGVAVSAGCDSVALLRILLELRRELGIVISVVHFNHKLRGAESDADQDFVEQLARGHRLEFCSSGADVRKHAALEGMSIETAAREVRRDFYSQLVAKKASGEIAKPALEKIATGHTLDDQAETVLMRVIRGTGGRGLGGIYPRAGIGAGGVLVRPLLGTRRRELEQYLRAIGQEWRDDSTNAELKFTRNRVRHVVLPVLEREFNPAIVERLGELAEIAQAEEDYWEKPAKDWIAKAVRRYEQFPEASAKTSLLARGSGYPAHSGPVTYVNRACLLAEPLAVRRRVIKKIGEQVGVPLEFKHVEEILRFAAENGAGGKELALPKGWTLVWKEESLVILAPSVAGKEAEAAEEGYQYQFTVPGSIAVPEIGSRFEVSLVGEPMGSYDADDLLDLSSLSNPLTVRNWRAGDRFWPARRKCEKKVKELLAELNMPQVERKMWPVIVSGSDIVWMRGFPVGAKFRAVDPGRDKIFVREISQG